MCDFLGAMKAFLKLCITSIELVILILLWWPGPIFIFTGQFEGKEGQVFFPTFECESAEPLLFLVFMKTFHWHPCWGGYCLRLTENAFREPPAFILTATGCTRGSWCTEADVTLALSIPSVQVATLTADLEKERSKVHALKLEIDKLKVSQCGWVSVLSQCGWVPVLSQCGWVSVCVCGWVSLCVCVCVR